MSDLAEGVEWDNVRTHYSKTNDTPWFGLTVDERLAWREDYRALLRYESEEAGEWARVQRYYIEHRVSEIAWEDLYQDSLLKWRERYRADQARAERETGAGDHADALAEESKRESEDEQVAIFRLQDPHRDRLTSWEHLDECFKDSWRKQYRVGLREHKREAEAERACVEETTDDPVKSPSHYRSLPAKCSKCGEPIECKDVVKHMTFPVGSAVKYLWRLDFKGNSIEQLRKAQENIQFEIERREALGEA